MGSEQQGVSRYAVGFIAVAVVVLAYLISIYLRLDSFTGVAGAESLEATYHVLWTMRALGDTPVVAHWFLPTVTLSPFPGNDIAWGAAIPSPGGAYLYTSFPPLGFLIPHGILAAVGAPLNPFSLALLNSFFGVIAALGMGLTARSVFNYARHEQPPGTDGGAIWGWIIFTASAVSYLFLRESLHAHGATYWAHSISQIVLIFACYFTFRHFAGTATARDRWLLVSLCALFPLLEWTGYIFTFGLVAALQFRHWRQSADGPAWVKNWFMNFALVRGLPQKILGATGIAGLFTLAHYAVVAGVGATVLAIGGRNVARGGSTKTFDLITQLPGEYWDSVGLLLPLGLAAIILALVQKRFVARPAIWFLLAVAGFVMVENLLIVQHAVQFSYDRAKIAVPLILGAVAFISVLSPKWRAGLLAAGIASIIASNLILFLDQQRRYAPWIDTLSRNDVIVAALRAEPGARCAVYGSPQTVRGYLNLTLDRDIYERQTEAELLGAISRGYCGAIMVDTRPIFSDLPAIHAIRIYDETGALRKVIE
ncbi:MAG: hypothetical protein GKS02_11765 [Alphaproteobacteria bacterium]|nr:hypothetical protein [Alphaproteobacteria bacterium]